MEQGSESMLIDWFTVAAQLINFAILMALLKRFLYKPILKVLDEREQKISGRLIEAWELKAEAEKEREEFINKNEDFERQRVALMKQVQIETETERLRMLEEARQESVILRANWRETLKTEQRNLHREIMDRTHREVFAIARKALSDLASESLEIRIVEAFIERLRNLAEPDKNKLALAVRASSHPVIVRSFFKLAPMQRNQIKQTIKEIFTVDMPVEFETDPEQICGIELTTNSYKVSWSIADYLSALEKSMDELLRDDTEARAEIGFNENAAG